MNENIDCLILNNISKCLFDYRSFSQSNRNKFYKLFSIY